MEVEVEQRSAKRHGVGFIDVLKNFSIQRNYSIHLFVDYCSQIEKPFCTLFCNCVTIITLRKNAICTFFNYVCILKYKKISNPFIDVMLC